ncbi:MAG TPA: Spy/CpxP family protein refolding chaperone [candidate division Zixibacteria bacterium]|nr:Spy/CpxP family protein refolding chaperone [candidate division Zixibacteria bacterium]
MGNFGRFLSAAAAGLIVLSLSHAGSAAPAGEEGPGKGWGEAGRRKQALLAARAPWVTIALEHRNELDLTGDQVAELEKIRSQHRAQTAPLVRQLREVEEQIAVLLQESPVNLIQTKLKIAEAEKLRSELRYLRIEALENGRSVLTPEQRERLEKLFASGRGFRRPHTRRS